MKAILICCLLFLVACHESDYQNLLYGILQGSELITPITPLNCKTLISRFQKPYFFDRPWKKVISDTSVLSETCGFNAAYETLQGFMQSPPIIENFLIKLDDAIENDRLFPESNLQKYGISVGMILKPFLALVSPTVLDFEFSNKFTSLKSGKYPIAIFHGLGDSCYYSGNIEFTEYIRKNVGTYTKCVEIGDGSNSSWLEPFQSQAIQACERIKEDTEFSNGLSIIGLSQGGLIARYIVEACGVPVRVVVTMGTPHMGVASMPYCLNGFYCDVINDVTSKDVYGLFSQSNIGPPGYFKDPKNYEVYLENSSFLADLNNEKSINRTYIERMQSLDNLIIVKFTEDSAIIPIESTWFGFFEGENVVPFNQTKGYIKNTLGLQQLYSKDKLHFIEIEGEHLYFIEEEFDELILPYLLD